MCVCFVLCEIQLLGEKMCVWMKNLKKTKVLYRLLIWIKKKKKENQCKQLTGHLPSNAICIVDVQWSWKSTTSGCTRNFTSPRSIGHVHIPPKPIDIVYCSIGASFTPASINRVIWSASQAVSIPLCIVEGAEGRPIFFEEYLGYCTFHFRAGVICEKFTAELDAFSMSPYFRNVQSGI